MEDDEAREEDSIWNTIYSYSMYAISEAFELVKVLILSLPSADSTSQF